MPEPVFPFDLDLQATHGTLVHVLHRQLRDAILDGRLVAGTPLPSSRQAAVGLGIARNTITAAYDLLVAEGYVVPRPRARSVVADVVARRPARAALPTVAATVDDARLAPHWRIPSMPAPRGPALPPRSFRVGMPEHQLFPHDTWRRLTARVLRRWSRAGFRYPPPEGLPELREAIANHVAFARAVACRAEDVVVTSGAQQAFDLLARLLVTPGQTRVAVEEPGYPPIRAAFAAAGARLVPVAVDDEGLCVDRLPDDVRVISVTPSHQSPTGATLSRRRRIALLEFARVRGAVVIEDDYDGEFRFGARPLDALQTLDRDGLVFYVGTFSKSLFPSLRQGFVVVPSWARGALVQLKGCADAHGDEIIQRVLAAFIRDGHLARHVRRMQPVYAGRRAALLRGINERLGRWLELVPSEAGLHVAARINPLSDRHAFMSKARKHLPGVQSTAEYAMAPQDDAAVVIGYGTIDEDAIQPALDRLARSLRR